MDCEKIVQELNRRFAEPLPDFYKRRIIFWIDEDKDFADKIDEIKIDNAEIIKLTGTNNFYVKKLLAVDNPTGNYLIYQPFKYESDEENWLLDVTFYARKFRADLISSTGNFSMRSRGEIKYYRRTLNRTHLRNYN